MIPINPHRVRALALIFALLIVTAPAVMAQETNQPSRAQTLRDEDTNLDVQLYLVLASNREIEDSKVPAVLDPVIKQLRETLNFKHYNLTATFLNRVKNYGHLDVSWVGGPFAIHGSPAQSNPSFSQFTATVRVVTDGNQEIVRLNEFRFGTRVPVVMGPPTPTAASTNAAPFPAIAYEPVGLRTDLSFREGAMVIAGTLNVGPSGDALVVVVSAKKAN